MTLLSLGRCTRAIAMVALAGPVTAQRSASFSLAELRRVQKLGPTAGVEAAAVACDLLAPSRHHRTAAADALVALKPEWKELLPRIRAAVTSSVAVGRRRPGPMGFAAPMADLPPAVWEEDLKSSDSARCAQAIKVVCAKGQRGMTHLPVLLALARDDRTAVRCAVARHVSRIAFDGRVRDQLARLLVDADADVRTAAAAGLAHAVQERSDDASALSILVQGIHDRSQQVRAEVVRGIARAGKGARSFEGVLLAAVGDPEVEVRLAGLQALAEMESKEFAPAARRGIDDKSAKAAAATISFLLTRELDPARDGVSRGEVILRAVARVEESDEMFEVFGDALTRRR